MKSLISFWGIGIGGMGVWERLAGVRKNSTRINADKRGEKINWMTHEQKQRNTDEAQITQKTLIFLGRLR